jgi:hypothetical protein
MFDAGAVLVCNEAGWLPGVEFDHFYSWQLESRHANLVGLQQMPMTFKD